MVNHTEVNTFFLIRITFEVINMSL